MHMMLFTLIIKPSKFENGTFTFTIVDISGAMIRWMTPKSLSTWMAIYGEMDSDFCSWYFLIVYTA